MARERGAHALIFESAFERMGQTMPVLLWLLGVPISIIILLMLLGAV
jgi:hypothetical protein